MSEDDERETIKLLHEIRREMNACFDSIDARFDRLGKRLDGLSEAVTKLAGNMGGHTKLLEAQVKALSKTD